MEPAEWYHSLPPVMKYYGTACLFTTISFRLGLVSWESLAFVPEYTFGGLQLWRLLTSFLFLGDFSFNFAMQLIFLARYGVQLERSATFNQRMADVVWMFFVTMTSFVALATLIPALNFYFMGPSLVFAIIYLWSREYSNARVNILGLLTIQGFYLPWAMLIVNTMFGGSFLIDFMGIVVAHVYYFATVLYPRTGGKNFLQTPSFVRRMLLRWGFEQENSRVHVPSGSRVAPPEPTATAQPPSAAQGTAFRGRSYRMDRD